MAANQEAKPTKSRKPRLELSAEQTSRVIALVRKGTPYSRIAAELDPSAAGTTGWQSLYDAVRRTAIEKLGGLEKTRELKKAGRAAAAPRQKTQEAAPAPQ